MTFLSIYFLNTIDDDVGLVVLMQKPNVDGLKRQTDLAMTTRVIKTNENAKEDDDPGGNS